MKTMKRLCIAGILALTSAHGLPSATGQATSPLYASTQLIVVTTQSWNAVEGELERFERAGPDGSWKAIGKPIEIVVGRNGMGWGAGVISTEELSMGTGEPVKREGDGKSPAGVFRVGPGFGYAAKAPAGWKLPYTRLTPSVECVDDSSSRFYNRIVDRTSVTPDWHSSEHMAEAGEAYRWGAVIAHNSRNVPRAGSCVFLHIWAGADKGTSGCTAMAQDQLKPILAWIDPARDPLVVQLPAANYSNLRKQLHLPMLRGK